MISSPHDETQPLSLRERKKRLAQATIEEAALRLFLQQGYEQTSIQDIADAVIMSPRTFFRYFSSKEEVLFGPMQELLNESLHSLQQVMPAEPVQKVLRTTLEYLASLFQQQRASFLIRYQVAKQTPSIASIYLFTLMKTEPVIREVLCARLESATDRNEIRFQVAIYMIALRVAIEEWVEQEAQGDLVSILHKYLDSFTLLPFDAGIE